MFKLIRVDNTDSSEIALPVGVHHFGRGVFLDCNDKKVSRQHGRLEVADNTLVLTALHTNPCFVIAKSTTTKQILKSGSSVILNAGDRFGLLPDTYWYRVEPTSDADTSLSKDPNCSNGHVEEEGEELLDFPFDEEMNEGVVGRSESPSLLDQEAAQDIQKERVGERESNEPPDDDQQPVSTAQQPDSTAQQPESTTQQPVAATQQVQQPGSTTQQLSSTTEATPEAQASSPAATTKRAHADTDEATDTPCKQTRTHTHDAGEEEDVKPTASQLAAAVATTSGSGEARDDTGDDCKTEVKKERAASPAASSVRPGRERCYYGAQCYRRNAQHQLDYSHPRDADWGPGALGLCPWGAACGRREARHWSTHEHPPGTAPPLHNRTNRGPPTTVVRNGATFYISAHAVHFHDDRFSVEDSDGDSVDYDYEF